MGPESDSERSPDFENLRRTLLRQGPPGPVPFFEVGVDTPVIGEVLGEKFPFDVHPFGPQGMPLGQSEEDIVKGVRAVDMFIRFTQKLGYDTAIMYTLFDFPRSFRDAADPAGTDEWSDGRRVWQDETTGPIQNWEDFEKYPWPNPEEVNYGAIEYINAVVPEGMKITSGYLGVFDVSSWLMGFQNFAIALYDQPDLVQAIMGRVADLVAAAVKHAVSLDNVEIVAFCDDMGFNKGTLVKPDFLKSTFSRTTNAWSISRTPWGSYSSSIPAVT